MEEEVELQPQGPQDEPVAEGHVRGNVQGQSLDETVWKKEVSFERKPADAEPAVAHEPMTSEDTVVTDEPVVAEESVVADEPVVFEEPVVARRERRCRRAGRCGGELVAEDLSP